MKRIIWLCTLWSIFNISLFAQSGEMGTIRGKIIDKTNGDVLMFTNVLVLDTDPPVGGQTDLDGNYEIKIAPGVYALKVSYVGYADQTITDVTVEAGKVAVVDFYLDEGGVDLEEVVVTAEAIERSENALLALQAKAITLQDGISSQEMSRYSGGNAAESMKRVTGASVVDGKYVYVRGLGDRYSNAQLNGLPLPSTDPYRNSTQLDLIPANLLDNLVVSKTFTPNQPGNFTGGSVNIKTKSFPETFTLSATISSSYNTQSSLRDDFLTHEGGDRDWLGFDDGTRALPSILQDPDVLTELTGTVYRRAERDRAIADLVDESSKSLNTNLAPTRGNSSVNHGVSLSFGNQYKLGNNPLGVLVGLNYRRNYSFYDDGALEYYELTDAGSDELNVFYQLSDTRGVDNTVLGGLVNLAYKFGGSNKITFNALYNHDGQKETRLMVGRHPGIISGAGTFESRVLGFMEREIRSYQLQGEHALGERGVRLEWGGSFVETSQDEPDLRQFANTFRVRDDGDTLFVLDPAEFDLPFHFFRELRDESQSGKVDLTIPFLQGVSKANEIKLGVLYTNKDRTFDESIFQINNSAGGETGYLGDPDAYFGLDNRGVVGIIPGEEPGDPDEFEIGLFAVDEDRESTKNSYTGSERVLAGYLMWVYELDRLKIITGARVEKTDIEVTSRDTSLEVGSIDKTDILPSWNLIYKLNDKMNLRGSFSQTLARPNMRELAPFTAIDFNGGFRITGNPNLERTLVLNYDLRWEWYPTPGEMFAVSTYYKDFSNPIVKAFLPVAANPEIVFQNVDKGTVYGIELEVRKRLGFIWEKLNDFKFLANLSYIYSEVSISEEELDVIDRFNPEKGDTRPFLGQSPYLINAGLNYQNLENGIDAIVSINIFGERLSEISEGRNPDIYEQPIPQLDFSFKKTFTNGMGVKFVAQNLLDPLYKKTMTYRDTEYLIQQFRRGVTVGFSLSYTIQ